MGVFQLALFLSSGVGVDSSALCHPKRQFPPGGLAGRPHTASAGHVSSAASHSLGFLGHRVEAPALSVHFPLEIQISLSAVFTCVISFNAHVSRSRGNPGETEEQTDEVTIQGHALNSGEPHSEPGCHSIPPR